MKYTMSGDNKGTILIVSIFLSVLGVFLSRAVLAEQTNPPLCNDADPEFPCTYHIDQKQIQFQKSKTTFKFQARISQAKIPLGDVTFSKVWVYILGDGQPCSEGFDNVKVRNGILNLEVGNAPSCDLDEMIANTAELKLKVCINGTTNCLETLSLSAVPYAIKSTYAFQAQEAEIANKAAQCHYAHRMTADRDLFVTHQIGKGYFDFHTPIAENEFGAILNGYSIPDHNFADGGYILWTPVEETESANLHIAAKGLINDAARPLDELFLHSFKTTLRGDLITEGSAKVLKGATIIKGLTVKDDEAALALTVGTDTTVENNATVKKDLSVWNNTVLGDVNALENDDYHDDSTCEFYCQETTHGSATFRRSVSIEGEVLDEDAGRIGVTVTGKGIFNNDLTVGGHASVSTGATITGGLDVTEGAGISGGLTVSEGAAITSGGLKVQGNSTTGNALYVDGTSATGKALHVEGSASISNGANINAGGLIVSGQNSNNDALTVTGQTQIENGTLYAKSGLDVSGTNGEGKTLKVTGKTEISDNTTITAGGLAVSGTIDGTGDTLKVNGKTKTTDRVEVTNGGMLVTGESTLSGKVNFKSGDIEIGESVNDNSKKLSIHYDTTFTGLVTLPSTVDVTLTDDNIGDGTITNDKLGINFGEEKVFSKTSGAPLTETIGDYKLCMLTGVISNTSTLPWCLLKRENGLWKIMVKTAECHVMCLENPPPAGDE